jgi:uncharacterized protein
VGAQAGPRHGWTAQSTVHGIRDNLGASAPRARKDEPATVRDGVVVVRVAAPPLDGRANEALCRLLADRPGVRPSSVTIFHGPQSRDKLVRVVGVDQAAADAALKL